MQSKDFRFREITYNYTSFSDKEIILKYFDKETWEQVELLRDRRITGRSAKLLYETVGDIFIIERNPYLYEEFLKNKKKRNKLKKIHVSRIETVKNNSKNDKLALSVISKIEALNQKFFKEFSAVKILRQKLILTLTGITSIKNIQFSPFHLVSHSTDATDWRVEYPFVVVYPDTVEEIPKLIKAAKKLGLSIIPRGGGTGLTGGAVPVNRRTMVINVEKFNKIGKIEIVKQEGREFPIIEAESGVVTDTIIEHCEKLGYIFATDPTSSWASTIGGNIAENAGGKKCVMWGTAIDNLYSFMIVNYNGDLLKIQRKNHPYRKILPNDDVVFDIYKVNGKGETLLKTINLTGTEIRKKGLGKDITNKALKGLPGLQKEGGDGLIVSAKFVLYSPFKYCKTICLEFFGSNMVAASQAIIKVNDLFANNEEVFLTALEHFDEKYVDAINYRNKSTRNEMPKAVLLIDLESNNQAALNIGCEEIINLITKFNAEGIIAKDEAERKIFWNDRKHLGAIAKHTNAFKLNEDIVIPLINLPDFADYIEQLNYIKEFENAIAAIDKINNYLTGILSSESEDIPNKRIEGIISYLKNKKDEYKDLIKGIDLNPETLKNLQNGIIKYSYAEEITSYYKKVLHGYDKIINNISLVENAERTRRIIIATHMHAGDGNVHVNIPVHSNDYLMMTEADEAAAKAMKKAVELGGVVSGEHGIGLTKLKFIDQSILDEYQEYKKINDPDDLFNPGKLNSNFPLYLIYTPSFNLLEREAIILEYTDLEKLSSQISSCVRCGKCKSVCNTHYPTGNMLYNPRNKILAVGAITEAVLFAAQTLDMKSFEYFKNLIEISDNCTVCHKCSIPCPVKIDFGDVSINIRKQLEFRKKSKLKLFTAIALFYLGRKKYFANKLLRILLLKYGYNLQRIMAYINKPISYYTKFMLPKISNILRSPFPKSGQKTLREIFNLKNPNTFYCFENKENLTNKSVVYFPGCGSERMLPEISIAVIALLYEAGIRVIIPPEYLCCGYPFLANGKIETAELKSYENRVIFHKMAYTAGYLNIEAIIVSCGTCYEMLEKYELSNIFNNAKLIDINEYIAQEKLYQKEFNDESLLYHDPCHSPLKHKGSEKTFKVIYGKTPDIIPNCCGEAGTLSLSRPDIANTLRDRKSANFDIEDNQKQIDVLTTCPSCVMGLTKLNGKLKVNGKSLSVYNAEQFLGKDWQRNFIRKVKRNGIERILF
jgi:FAD/FMN-containing dehydrogenase/Fe-S oxidoreductase